MATKEPIYYGKLAEGEMFAQPELSIKYDDRRYVTITMVARWEDIKGEGAYVGQRATDWLVKAEDLPDASHYYIIDLEKSRRDALVGVITAQLVHAPNGVDKEFAVTYNIEMREVQKSLETHYLLMPAKLDADSKNAQKQIRKWNMTNEAARTKWDENNDPTFYYFNFDERGSAVGKELKVNSVGAKKYCAAKTAGIDSFNLYLPVIQKVSNYVRPKGVKFDPDTHAIEKGATFEICDDDETIGQFCDPPVKIKGYTDSDKYRWFKSVDQWQMNADTTWTRTEEWVCTNDLNHTWIYDGKLE